MTINGRTKHLFVLLLACLLFQGVSPLDTISQWVAIIRGFSHQNTNINSAAVQIIGAPDVYPYYGDRSLAWAPATTSAGNEYIEFEINSPVFVTSVATYETLSSGFVVKILALMPNGLWDELWSGTVTLITSSRIFTPPLRTALYSTKVFRINMDGSAAGANWIELDAVRVTGSITCPVSTSLIPLDNSDRLIAAKLTDCDSSSCVSGRDGGMLRYLFNQTVFNQTSLNMAFNVTLMGSSLRCSPSSSLGYYQFTTSGQLMSSSGTSVYADKHDCKLGTETSLSCRFECNCQSASCGMLALWYIGCGTPNGTVCEVLVQ